MVELASLTPPASSLMNYFTADVATRAVGSIFCVKWWGFPLLFPLADWFLWGVLLMKFSLLLHGLPNLQQAATPSWFLRVNDERMAGDL